MRPEWKANWIWCSLPEYTENVYLECRKSFALSQKPVDASIRISANQEYKLMINGLEIGRGPSPCDNAWQYYDTYEVSQYLKPGENVLAILAYNLGTKEVITGQFQGPGGVIADLEVKLVHESMQLGTDSTWKCRRSPRWVAKVSRQHMWNGFREIYLADQEDGWEHPGYDDNGWHPAIELAKAEDKSSAWPRLIPREIPFLRMEEICADSLVRTEENYGSIAGEVHLLRSDSEPLCMTVDAGVPGSCPSVVYDFNREVVGYVQLVVHAPRGGVIQLHYGETLNLALYDTFIMKQGENKLSVFGRRAFRYIKLQFEAAPHPIEVKRFYLQFVGYPFKARARFDCSDKLLQNIWEVGVYTTEVNSQDHLEDTPLREKALWIADAVVMGKVIYHAFGDHQLLKKCLKQSARIQNSDGSIPGTGPERNRKLLPDFCAHWLFGVFTHWKYTGDRAFLQEVWPTMVRLMGWFEANEEPSTGLFTIKGKKDWWCFIDWADYIDKREQVTAISCFYYKALLEGAQIARELGEEAADVWEDKARKLKDAIRKHLWTAERHAFIDCATDTGKSEQLTAQTNFAAIWSGVADDKEADCFIDELFMRNKTPSIRGAFFYHIVLETLFERKRSREAVGLIREYWGGMLRRGATTWWETFEPNLPECTVPSPYQGHTPTYLRDDVPVSCCHGWGASPSYLLIQNVLGIDILQLGEKKVHLRPIVSDLEWAEGEIPTAYGPISVNWRLIKGKAEGTVSIPNDLIPVKDEGHSLQVIRM